MPFVNPRLGEQGLALVSYARSRELPEREKWIPITLYLGTYSLLVDRICPTTHGTVRVSEASAFLARATHCM